MKQFLYTIKNNLYINLTNRCPCRCTFCIRQTKEEVHNSGNLWLTREPTAEEVKKELDLCDISKFNEIVFCGYGEPTERLADMLDIAAYIKKKFHKSIRVNTNGLSDLINGRDTTSLFQGKVDAISISLNAPTEIRYYELTRNEFGLEAFHAIIEFVINIKKYIPEVTLTTVASVISREEEEECLLLCNKLNVSYKIRKYED